MSDTDKTTKCEDCPPVGYPTDRTRCIPCPRRSAEIHEDQGCPDCGEPHEGKCERPEAFFLNMTSEEQDEFIREGLKNDNTTAICPHCMGSGEGAASQPCWTCNGSGGVAKSILETMKGESDAD